MRKKIKAYISATAASATLLVSNVAFGAASALENPSSSGFQTNLSAIVDRILDAILGIAALVAVVYIIIGGFTYLTSGGNSEATTKAKNTLVSAIIGLVVIAAAFAIKIWATQLLLGTDVSLEGTGL